MDNIRFAFICALGAAVFLLWQAWQDDYGSQQPPTPPKPHQQQPSRAADSVSDIPTINQAPTPSADKQKPPTSLERRNTPDTPRLAGSQASGNAIHVVTDKLDVTIDLRGGDIIELELRDVAGAHGKNSLLLLNDSLPNFFVTQSGLISKNRSAPNHRDTYQSKRQRYQLEKGDETLTVPLVWQTADGRTVTKIYTFHRGSYKIGLRYKISNSSGASWVVSPYFRFWRVLYQHGNQAPFASSFSGVGFYKAAEQGQEYSYTTFDIEALTETNLSDEQTGGWIAMVQHYFLGAAIPGSEQTVSYFAQLKPVSGANEPGYASGYIGERVKLATGETVVLDSTLFIGPKLQDQLDDVAPGLGLTVDYGIFTIIAGPIFWILEKLHDLVGNWGVAIILLTVIIKLAFYKLSETQYRAMARMRKFAPRMQQLKEQYGDDKQKLQEKMMELYKKEGFNPLGGCWPLLVQMPVFIALYWVLRASVELRNADFILWINDLSSPDPYYILPVLFGITMFVQQKLSSSSMSMDPMQQRMMQIMPIGLAVFFAFFPAGLVLYWLTNNLLSIAQQWYIYRKLDNEGGGNKAPAK